MAKKIIQQQWNPWQGPRKFMRESNLARYGMALFLPVVATVLIQIRPPLADAPFFIFLAVIVLSAANGGVAPAFVSTALSAFIIRFLFLPGRDFALRYHESDYEGMERMGAFVLVAMGLSSVVAALRRERNSFRESEERYRLLAESASDAILVIDDKGEILYANALAGRTFGISAEELPGKNLNCLLPGGGYQVQLHELKERLDTRKKPVAMRLPGLCGASEKLLVEMTLGSSCHRGKSVFTAVIRDITGQDR